MLHFKEEECSLRWGCIPDLKHTLRMDLILLITCLMPRNSTIALFTACTSLDYIQGWIFLWIVRCTERDCHTFRWVCSAGPSWLPHPGVDVFLSLSRGLQLSWSAFWVGSAWVRSCSCELLLLSNRSRPSCVTYMDLDLKGCWFFFSWFPSGSVTSMCKDKVLVLWTRIPLPPWVRCLQNLNFA